MSYLNQQTKLNFNNYIIDTPNSYLKLRIWQKLKEQ
jgi:hypothetical protein